MGCVCGCPLAHHFKSRKQPEGRCAIHDDCTAGSDRYEGARKRMMALAAYLDETGTHGAPRVLVGGCIATDTEWACFDESWGQLLENHGLTRLHARDFFSGKTTRGWTGDDRRAFLRRALEIIRATEYSKLLYSVETDDFFRFSEGERRYLTGGGFEDTPPYKWKTSGAPTKPYFMAFRNCVAGCVKNFPGDDPITFFFDRHSEYEANAKTMFDQMAYVLDDRGRKRIGDLVFGQERTPLQLADLICFISQRNLNLDLQWKQDYQDVQDAIEQTRGDITGTNDGEAMERMLAALKPEARKWMESS